MYKTHDEITTRILSMSSSAEDEQDRNTESDTHEVVELDKREGSHITVVPFNPVQVGSFQ
ncbi:hypothetical protein [uncultured Oxalicibacterium sp.]|uniref:hypothetical protein n=1 Tax=uncultured Oxalicibacterium sp. TaxID=1168540 RepID=UPI0025E28611|nr:hypothetical protein [uncultured Oxalicibacterium sp.]